MPGTVAAGGTVIRGSMVTGVSAARRRVSEWDLERLSLAAALLLGLLFGVAQATGIIAIPIDFVIYWRNTDLDHLYPVNWTDNQNPYLYPPVLAQVLLPLHVLPYELVQIAWTVVCFASLWYCVRAWTVPIIALGFVAIWLPVDNILGAGLEYALLGNVQLPMAAAIVAGIRHPGWFAFPIVTKVTAGVGLLWYLFRGEWRQFAVGVGATATIVAVSFLISPATWTDWLRFTVDNYGQASVPPIVGPPLPLRLAAAVTLVAWGARTNRPWVVAIAGAVALPALYGVRSFVSVAFGAWALRRSVPPPRSEREEATIPAAQAA